MVVRKEESSWVPDDEENVGSQGWGADTPLRVPLHPLAAPVSCHPCWTQTGKQE